LLPLKGVIDFFYTNLKGGEMMELCHLLIGQAISFARLIFDVAKEIFGNKSTNDKSKKKRKK